MNTFTFLPTCRNFSEAKILVVPGYLVDILGVRLPGTANDFIFIYCTRAGSSGAQRVERKNVRCN
ncbi:hypothetical protein [Methanosarcina sp. 2.H.A.1B.4]|uniref:hypothetical protein n=1 Tax=Methanosarcina sp. 2.H.A.1B.4 TaxID=1483600 RepID=UPI0006210197|nr:hypothetical protein [Methanosarcina sp. 2.H.A.1B.4]KKG08805.1 hypothetical protein EO92_13410 [Methanosarcina sp. 2.H.A.1B.4]